MLLASSARYVTLTLEHLQTAGEAVPTRIGGFLPGSWCRCHTGCVGCGFSRGVRRVVLGFAVVGVVACGAPAESRAAVYCVRVPRCSNARVLSIQRALDLAYRNGPGRDVIRLGPGSYRGGLLNRSGSAVELRGSGSGTVLHNARDGGAALTLEDKRSLVRNLSVTLAHRRAALGLVVAGTASSVRVSWGAYVTQAEGVVLSGSRALLSRSRIDGGSVGFGVNGREESSSGRVADSVIKAHYGVVNAVSVVRSQIAVAGPALEGDPPQGPVESVGLYDVGKVADTSIRLSGAAAGLVLDDCGGDLRCIGGPAKLVAEARNVTIGGGGRRSVGVRVTSNGGAVELGVATSVVRGLAIDFDREGNGPPCLAPRPDSRRNRFCPTPATIKVDKSDLNTHRIRQRGTGSFSTSGCFDVDPRFVSARTGDLRLRFDSPLVDRGEPRAGRSQELDAGGRRRYVDGDMDGRAVSDTGAFEYQGTGPRVAMRVRQAGEHRIIFTAPARDPDGGPLTYRWQFGDGTFGTGRRVVHHYLRGRHYRVELAVTEPG